jgi:serine/threonine protein kinase
VSFAYDRQIAGKLVFVAHVTSAAGGLQAGQEIIVKYAETYSADAHQRCYDHEQSAPHLYAHSLLPNGWNMVVMERVAGGYFKGRREKATLQQRLRSAVAHLHAGGLVHGDLRANNVLVVGDRVCLLDFDWSGPAGVQRYPGFMNHGQIDWPAGASDGEPLQVEHDNVWLVRLMGN